MGPTGENGATGDKGEKGDTGATGEKGDKGDTGATGAKGDKGDQGVAGKDGKDGRDFDMDESLALSAALSMPAWLEAHENFAISGGVGFSDGEAALGATGIVRIDRGVSGFVGGAVGSGGDNWAGKAGMRVGW